MMRHGGIPKVCHSRYVRVSDSTLRLSVLIYIVQNLFGSTECSAMFFSIGGKTRNAPLLRPVEGVAYDFFPVEPSSPSESGHQSTGRMLELIILAESGDCPDPSLRHADGHFHTGDLFQEVSPGCYVSRGRDDDWIKSEIALRCDTR